MATVIPQGLGSGVPAGAGAPRRRSALSRVSSWAAAVPFLVYALVFLGVPVVMLVYGAFHTPDGHVSAGNMTDSVKGAYGSALWGSVRLSAETALISAVAGLGLAYLVLRANHLKRVVLTASGVFANFGGVPLAFMFIATLGNAGVVTTRLNLGDAGFTLYGFFGLGIVYLYFLVPLMVLTVLPALEALRVQWQEAAANLGASTWQYVRYVAGPVLLPSLLGGFVLLFGSAFSAYATARALMGASSVPLVTLYVANGLSSNVSTNSANVSFALSLDMIVVAGLVMAVYLPLQRRTTRWLNS